MSISNLLHEMCADLAEADLNAIRKARGFRPSETASRTSFASYFVSSIGVTEALQNISAEEIITLHLLHQTGEVDVSFFERLYGSAAQHNKRYYGTFTQQYKSTFDAVKKNLVRRGIVVMAEVKMRGDTVQMERWRFALPPEFFPYLPPLLPVITSDESGETSDHAVRKKLLQLIGGNPAFPNDRTKIEIKDGTICLDDQPFSAARLQDWQKRAWWMSLNTSNSSVPASLSITEAASRLLASLAPREWTRPENIDPALKIFCFGGKIQPAEKILHQGWELGLLSRLKAEGSTSYYRLASTSTLTASDDLLADTLPWVESTPKADSAKIDLRLIPIQHLELFNLLTHLSVEKNELQAAPSPIKLGRATPQQRNTPLSLWLSKHIPAFEKAIVAVNEKWGRTILHENLLIARVRDLNLRVQLERELAGNLVLLDEQFIAFPSEFRSVVERTLKKTGFVAKTIHS
jgi:hypothetical protein